MNNVATTAICSLARAGRITIVILFFPIYSAQLKYSMKMF